MKQIRVFGELGGLVLGTANGFESHGAGLLDLLFATWRPEGRAPRLDDTFWFETNRARLPLAALYASHRNQIFLPVPGVATEATAARFPIGRNSRACASRCSARRPSRRTRITCCCC